MRCRNPYQSAILAIALVVGAANLGIVARLFAGGLPGQLCFVLTRLLLLILPWGWFHWVERGQVAPTWPSKRQIGIGTILGTLMFGVILGAYWGVGKQWINPLEVRLKAAQIGLASPGVYAMGACYFTIINSLLEEYLWRWFLCRQWEVLVPENGAIGLAALCFTLHHSIALAAYTQNGAVVLLGSLGVFIAGAIWSWCYFAYRSLWVCYISHLIADLAIALIGWNLLFAAIGSGG